MVNATSVVREHAVRLSAVLEELSERGDHRFEVQVGIEDAVGWRSAAVLVDPARGGLLEGASEVRAPPRHAQRARGRVDPDAGVRQPARGRRDRLQGDRPDRAGAVTLATT